METPLVWSAYMREHKMRGVHLRVKLSDCIILNAFSSPMRGQGWINMRPLWAGE